MFLTLSPAFIEPQIKNIQQKKSRKLQKSKLEFAALQQLLHSIKVQEESMQKDVGMCVICKCYAISYQRHEHPQRLTTSRWRCPGTNPQWEARANLANSTGERHRAPSSLRVSLTWASLSLNASVLSLHCSFPLQMPSGSINE